MTKPFKRHEFLANVANSLERRRLRIINEENARSLETRVIERTQQVLEHQDALQSSERLLKGILLAAPLGIAYVEQGKLIWTNQRMADIFGHRDETDYLKAGVREHYESEDEYKRVQKFLYERLKDGKVAETEAKFRRKDGSIFWGQLRISAPDPSDPKKGTITTISDITERKRAEEVLRESEEKYRVLVQTAHEGIHVVQDGIFKFVNSALVEIYERSEEELLSRPFTEFLHPDDRAMVRDRAARRARGEKLPSRYAHRILTPDGKTKWIEIDSAAISWAGKPAVLV
ncbi:MAG: PAS domain-containing protein [Desulfomonilaceae bacterium]